MYEAIKVIDMQDVFPSANNDTESRLINEHDLNMSYEEPPDIPSTLF